LLFNAVEHLHNKFNQVIMVIITARLGGSYLLSCCEFDTLNLLPGFVSE
jgi:hypothetical protein